VDGGGHIGRLETRSAQLVSGSGLKLDKDDSAEDQASGKQQVKSRGG